MFSFLKSRGYNAVDLGNSKYDPHDDYPDFAQKAGEEMKKNKSSRAILFCGSGAGVCIGANRLRGMRAVLAHDARIIQAARRDDDANIVCLGADFISENEAKKIILAFLKTSFSGAKRHKRRILKLEKI